MQSKTIAQEPAFPVDNVNVRQGLSKREYFAAMALQGILANPSHLTNRIELVSNAIFIADKLIEELNVKTT